MLRLHLDATITSGCSHDSVPFSEPMASGFMPGMGFRLSILSGRNSSLSRSGLRRMSATPPSHPGTPYRPFTHLQHLEVAWRVDSFYGVALVIYIPLCLLLELTRHRPQLLTSTTLLCKCFVVFGIFLREMPQSLFAIACADD